MRPDSIRKFDMFYLGAVALGVFNFFLGFDRLSDQVDAELAGSGVANSPSYLVLGIAIGTAISLGLWYLISRRRIEFVKWILVIFFAWGLISLPGIFVGGLDLPDVIGLVVYALQGIAIAFLFRADAKAWFARKDSESDLG